MKHLFILLISLTALISCSKKVSDLPDASATGSKTFGAKVDGKMWAPQGFGIMPTASTLEVNYNGGDSYRINARNFGSSPTETEFEFILNGITAPGTYMLNQETSTYPNETASYASYTLRKFNLISLWKTSPVTAGKVVITKIDRANKIIAGSFEFSATDTYGGAAPIHVTEGRFDLKLH
jgi:hypothetical protein